jgi:DNA-binding LytR/AlgR family response regulator
MREITALVADDEPLARVHLRSLLEEQSVRVVGEAGNAKEALSACEELRPHVVFLDIEMPGMNGLQLAASMKNAKFRSQIVFVTGYSEHAVEAFEKDAADYLLKPVSPERLSSTLARIQNRLEQSGASAPQVRGSQPRIPIRSKSSVRFVRTDRVQCAFRRGTQVILATLDSEEVTPYSLAQLEDLLTSPRFMRIHSSCLVNLDAVEELLFYGNHTYGVRLRRGGELPVSRSAFPELKMRMGV